MKFLFMTVLSLSAVAAHAQNSTTGSATSVAYKCTLGVSSSDTKTIRILMPQNETDFGAIEYDVPELGHPLKVVLLSSHEDSSDANFRYLKFGALSRYFDPVYRAIGNESPYPNYQADLTRAMSSGFIHLNTKQPESSTMTLSFGIRIPLKCTR